jgi:hypothetical protein
MDSMNFKNDTDYAIVVSSWIEQMRGLSSLIDVLIPPRTEKLVTSSVGEWTIGSLFEEREYYDQWNKSGLPFTCRLAKFRSEPCHSGDYTWNYTESRFDLKYENGVVIWSKK